MNVRLCHSITLLLAGLACGGPGGNDGAAGAGGSGSGSDGRGDSGSAAESGGGSGGTGGNGSGGKSGGGSGGTGGSGSGGESSGGSGGAGGTGADDCVVAFSDADCDDGLTCTMDSCDPTDGASGANGCVVLADNGQCASDEECDPTQDPNTNPSGCVACAAPAAGEIGGPCVNDTECDSAPAAGDGLCLRGAIGARVWPAVGYCTNKVGVCVEDVDCGAGNVCATLQGASLCLRACAVADCVCPGDQLCANTLGSDALDKDACLPGDAAAVDGDPCASFGDCSEGSACLVDGDLEYPGGQCMQVGCTLGNDATCTHGTDSKCVDPGLLPSVTGCVDGCAIDADCRIAEGYRCVDAGGPTGRFCRHPQVGDACAAVADCGPDVTWSCLIGASFLGGMCTLDGACPTAGSSTGCTSGSSVCTDPAAGSNHCVDACPGPLETRSTCRMTYRCRDVDPGGTTVLGCVGDILMGTSPNTTGQLVISEIMYDPSLGGSDTSEEWFEVHNPSGAVTYDMLGCVLTSPPATHTVNANVVMAPGDYTVLAATTMVTGLVEDYVYGTALTLANASDTITITCNDVAIDTVAYDEASGWPAADGESLGLDPTTLTSADNDAALNWCIATVANGIADPSSPGLPNMACPP
jgi:hypothetical protein